MADYHGFQHALERLINQYSLENRSNTPDFILAAYLMQCLDAWEMSQTMRDGWYGVPRQQTASVPPLVDGIRVLMQPRAPEGAP